MCYVNMERRVIPHSVGKCHAVTKGLGTCQVRRSLHWFYHIRSVIEGRSMAVPEQQL